MASLCKININDHAGLRKKIDALCEQSDSLDLANWAILCARRVLPLAKLCDADMQIVEDGFRINALCQAGKAGVHALRQAGFSIHRIARNYPSDTKKNALRAAGHAVGTGHMKEHAMVCSDYVIKTLELAFPGHGEIIERERTWQRDALNGIRDRHEES
ncbi:MAG: hypothetical protein PHX07_03740 [Candidatus Marinimicrobia bacterium]|jgi:hypothetical protein|nr:hypothetical protein [Candidatus Neomarinimicrobiota bacterium]MDD4961331.1 hypothetical protein [Candidatus Neomarinimicrobiota bacterium]MDX9777145.1 hypothetical protein [bacterium]